LAVSGWGLGVVIALLMFSAVPVRSHRLPEGIPAAVRDVDLALRARVNGGNQLPAGVAFAAAHLKVTPGSLTLAAVSLVTVGLALWELRAAILARLPPRLLAGAIAAMPIGLWLSIHVGASVYAASLGAMLTTLVLYAFMRRAPSERDDGETSARAGVPANHPDVGAAVKSLLLAVAGVGLLARVM